MFSQATYSRKLVFLSSAWISYACASSYSFGVTNTCHYISSEFLSERWSPEMLGVIEMTGSPGQLYAIIWTFIICMFGSLVSFELGALGVWLCFFCIVCLLLCFYLLCFDSCVCRLVTHRRSLVGCLSYLVWIKWKSYWTTVSVISTIAVHLFQIRISLCNSNTGLVLRSHPVWISAGSQAILTMIFACFSCSCQDSWTVTLIRRWHLPSRPFHFILCQSFLQHCYTVGHGDSIVTYPTVSNCISITLCVFISVT